MKIKEIGPQGGIPAPPPLGSANVHYSIRMQEMNKQWLMFLSLDD